MVVEVKNLLLRQGIIFEIVPKNASSLGSGIYLILSHDCDLARSCEQEPNVELLKLKRIDAGDGSYAYGKNPRKIHFPLTNGDYYEAMIQDRLFTPREKLHFAELK